MRIPHLVLMVLAFVAVSLSRSEARAQARTDVAQWDFEGDLSSTTGQEALTEQGTASFTIETQDIGGSPADVAHFTQGTYFMVLHGFPSNGGGVYLNQYTLIMDVMFPDRTASGGYAALLQTTCCNANDADWFIGPTGGLGLDPDFGGDAQDGVWHRVALTVDLVAGVLTSYLDGEQVQQTTRATSPALDLALDGRFSLYCTTNPDLYYHFFIFADNDSQAAEGYVNSVQFRNQILAGSEIAKLGGATADGIPLPALSAQRTLPKPVTAGATFPVSITISTSIDFNAATIRERIPRYWTAASPSAPGRIEVDAEGRQTLVWDFTGGLGNPTLTYQLTSPKPFANVAFQGSSVVADGTTFLITGDTQASGGTDGFAAEALVITMLQSTTACGGNFIGEIAQARDYLADDDAERESTVAPAAGDTVTPDFLGVSPSPGPTGKFSLTWARMTGPLFQVNACDDCMGYLAFYAENTTGAPLVVSVASGSDDGEQILIDGREVWNHSIPRGNGRAQVQDRTPLFPLSPGKHLVMQKVFEGCGGFDSSIRFEDEDQNPFTGPVAGGPLVFSLDPSGSAAAGSFVMREIPQSLDVGESGKVTLKLRVRAAGDGATIEENAPAGFAISAISDGGVQSGQKITWSFSGPLSSRDLSYRVAVPEGAKDSAFSGTAALAGVSRPILGDQAFNRGAMNAAGFIKHWLLLGPLDTLGIWPGDPNNAPASLDAPSATPENGDLRLDFLTDGVTTEKNIHPFDGMRISPSFAGAAGDGVSTSKAVGLKALIHDCAPAVPTWERFIASRGTLSHDDYFGESVDSHATYSGCYVTNKSGAAIHAVVAMASDDAAIVLLDGSEILAYEPPPCSATQCGRGYGAEDSVQNTAPVTIDPGEHFLLARVHDGTEASGIRLRFQSDQGAPILDDQLTVSTRSTRWPPEVYARRILSSDRYREGGDPITVTLRVESNGAHTVDLTEVLPADWSAGTISHSGAQAGGAVSWHLAGVSGVVDVTYILVPGECSGSGSYCSNGTGASQYSVDGGSAQALRGDSAFQRDPRGTDDLGAWDVRDIGTSGGWDQRVDDFGVDVTGKGGGIRRPKDEFRFVSLPATGDFEISTRIQCMDDLAQQGVAGLMVRDTYDTFAATVYFGLNLTPPAAGGVGTLTGLVRKQTKSTTSVTAISISDREVPSLPIRLKLARAGANLSMQRSLNGVDYDEVATFTIGTASTDVNLQSNTLVGLATTAGGGSATRVEYREVTFPPGNPTFTPQAPLAPVLASAIGGKEQVSLSWTAPASGPAPDAYEIYRGGEPGGPNSLIQEVPATALSYSDGGLADDTQYCYVLKSKKGAVRSVSFSNEICARTAKAVTEPTFRRGDVDGNTKIEVTDAIGILGHLFLGDNTAWQCAEAADTDNDGNVDVTDAVNNLNFQFLGGTPPAAPGPRNCGSDEGGKFLGCSAECK